MSIRGKAAIVGIHEYESRFDPQASELSIQADSISRALDDAGLTKDDVDAMYSHSGFLLAEYLNIFPDNNRAHIRKPTDSQNDRRMQAFGVRDLSTKIFLVVWCTKSRP